jgi:hypothetical protein
MSNLFHDDNADYPVTGQGNIYHGDKIAVPVIPSKGQRLRMN